MQTKGQLHRSPFENPASCDRPPHSPPSGPAGVGGGTALQPWGKGLLPPCGSPGRPPKACAPGGVVLMGPCDPAVASSQPGGQPGSPCLPAPFPLEFQWGLQSDGWFVAVTGPRAQRPRPPRPTCPIWPGGQGQAAAAFVVFSLLPPQRPWP